MTNVLRSVIHLPFDKPSVGAGQEREVTMIIDNGNQRAKFSPALLCVLLLASPAFASDAARKQAQANFQIADVNQDGQLDAAEFQTFINLNADHGLGRASTVRRFGAYGQAFSKLDTNGDGVVARQEIAAQAPQ